MDQRRIWAIIGIMSAALIGVGGLQAYWINGAIRLNEAEFDKNVREALNRVADKIQYLENARAFESLQKTRTEASGEAAKNLLEPPKFFESATTTRLVSPKNATAIESWEYLKVSQLIDQKPLAERVEPDVLARSIREEMSNRGIAPPYDFGVFSIEKNSFVIHNDHFTVIDQSPQLSSNAGLATVSASPFRVALFGQDIASPGFLAIHFPGRSRAVLRTVTGPLIASILFTSLILGCFAYTIWVIFRQKKLSEMKSDFINNMTHEFKTPIATISLAADSIESPKVIGDPDRIRRFSNIIRQENRRMNEQVEKVLQLALLDKKEYNLKLSEVDAHELIEQAAQNFSLQIEKRDGILELKLEAENSKIEADATHFASIIQNLLDNANKYSPEKPEITVSTKSTKDGLEITVADRGIGISKEARRLVFDKFFRVGTGNLHDVKGFGLGLSYVKTMVEAHRGTVEVRSELGKGSEFVLFFPFRQA